MAFLIVVFAASFFTWSLPHVETFRLEHPALVFALPLLTIFLWWDRRYPRDVLSTRQEVQALSQSDHPRPVTAWAGIKQVFKTLIAHAFGASVGREAVGLQLGAWGARLRATRGWYFAVCMAAGFAVVLGTPVAAAIFIFESKRWRMSWTEWAAIPLFSWMATQLSWALGVTHVELHSFDLVAGELSAMGPWRASGFFTALITASMVVAGLFLLLLRFTHRWSEKHPKKSLFAAFLFFSAVALFFYLVPSESMGLPGLGTQGLYGLWSVDLKALTFHPILIALMKATLTAVFVGFGVRGGEFTPLLLVGAMLAVGVALVLNLPAMAAIAIGLPLVWGIAARRPWTAAILAVELFGFAPWGLLAPIIGVSVYAGIKLGDFLMVAIKNREILGTWRSGLYDDAI